MGSKRFVERLCFGAIVLLAAGCGGGGGSNPPTLTPDTPAPIARVSAPTPTPKASPTAASTPSASPVATASATAPASHAPTSAPTTPPTAAPTTAPKTPPPTAVPTPTPTPIPGPSLLPVAAKAADSIVDMIGVVTHFAYSNTVYGYLTPSNPAPNGDSVLSSLQTLGVRHLRDGNGQMATNPALCSAFQQAYAAGIDSDIGVLPGTTVASLPAISACIGPALRAVEGPNELDLSGDANYAADDVTAMSVISAARGSAYPAGVTLFAPSMANTCTSYQAEAAVSGDAIAGFFDYNNAHIYYSGYAPETTGYGSLTCALGPFGSESTDIAEAKIPAPSKPIVVTETGYPDNCCGFNDPGYVPASIKTKYTLRTVLEHYNAGARYAYFYELASESQSYGLTDQYLNPKPAYTALENFIHILRDPGGSGAGGTLRYSLGGAIAPVSQILFKKQDGSFWLVLWLKNQGWDPINNVPITVPAQTGTITFTAPPAYLRMYTFDPATGITTATALTPNLAVNPISVSDTPEILEVGATSANPVLATPQPPVY